MYGRSVNIFLRGVRGGLSVGVGESISLGFDRDVVCASNCSYGNTFGLGD